MISMLPTFALMSSAMLVLTACLGGGGGGGSTPSAVPSSIQKLTGLDKPAETVSAQEGRGADIVSRADSLILSTTYFRTTDSGIVSRGIQSQCSGTRCRVNEPATGYSATLRLSDLYFGDYSPEAVGTKHDITLVSWTEETRLTDFEGYGAWMEHSGFAVLSEKIDIAGVKFDLRNALAGGDLTGTRPTGSATWTGLMVGTPADGPRRGDRLQGIAELDFDLEANELDVNFSDIKNIDLGTGHSPRALLFEDLTVASDGTFEDGVEDNRIQGGFYGTGHAEAAGVFEKRNIVGAFGAKLQMEPAAQPQPSEPES